MGHRTWNPPHETLHLGSGTRDPVCANRDLIPLRGTRDVYLGRRRLAALLIDLLKLEKQYLKLTILKGKKMIQYKNSVQEVWLLLTFFICLHDQLSSFNSIIAQMSEKHDSLSEQ